MEEPKHRLKHARINAGYETPSDAARALKSKGVNKNTLISHENGNRPLSRKAAERYGKLFGVSAGWLLFGEGSDGLPQKPIEHLREVVDRAAETGSTELQERIIDFAEFELDRYEKSRETET